MPPDALRQQLRPFCRPAVGRHCRLAPSVSAVHTDFALWPLACCPRDALGLSGRLSCGVPSPGERLQRLPRCSNRSLLLSDIGGIADFFRYALNAQESRSVSRAPNVSSWTIRTQNDDKIDDVREPATLRRNQRPNRFENHESSSGLNLLDTPPILLVSRLGDPVQQTRFA